MSVPSRLREDTAAPSRWPVLDGVRGAAVIAVVLWHVYRVVGDHVGMTARSVAEVWWPLGTLRFGVDAFFVLSGFLVVQSWRSIRARRSTWGASREFFTRRILRIGPGYWVALIVMVPLIAPALLASVQKLGLLVSINGYVDYRLPGRINVVFWSLTTELHFYLLLPLIAWLMTRAGRWPVYVCTLALTGWWWLHLPGDFAPSFIFGRLDQFVVGAVAAELVTRAPELRPSPIVRAARWPGMGVALAAALLALGTYHGKRLGALHQSWFDPWMHPAVGVVCALLIIRLVAPGPSRGLGRALSHPVWRLLGIISFSLYLWHYPILAFGFDATGLDPRTAPWLSGVVLAALVVAALAVAALAYVWVERPALQLRRARRERVEREPVVTAEPGVPVEAGVAGSGARADGDRAPQPA